MLESYPSLTALEFREACSNFEARCHDKLSGTDWLSVKWKGQELLIAQTKLAGRHTGEADTQDGEEENEIKEIEIDGVDEEEAVCGEYIISSGIEHLLLLTQTSSNVPQTRKGSTSTFR